MLKENSKQYRIHGLWSTHVKARPVAKERVGDVVNTSVGLSRQDAQAIGDALGKDVEIGWRARIPVSITSLKAPLHTTPFLGVSPNLMPVHSLDVSEGRALLPIDHVRGRRVAVLGAQLAERAFPRGAIGQVFRLDYAWFEVVGSWPPEANPVETYPSTLQSTMTPSLYRSQQPMRNWCRRLHMVNWS